MSTFEEFKNIFGRGIANNPRNGRKKFLTFL